jgi:hypothetical protein
MSKKKKPNRGQTNNRGQIDNIVRKDLKGLLKEPPSEVLKKLFGMTHRDAPKIPPGGAPKTPTGEKPKIQIGIAPRKFTFSEILQNLNKIAPVLCREYLDLYELNSKRPLFVNVAIDGTILGMVIIEEGMTRDELCDKVIKTMRDGLIRKVAEEKNNQDKNNQEKNNQENNNQDKNFKR